MRHIDSLVSIIPSSLFHYIYYVFFVGYWRKMRHLYYITIKFITYISVLHKLELTACAVVGNIIAFVLIINLKITDQIGFVCGR